MKNGTLRIAVVAIIATTLWRMVASKVPGIGRFAA
jgi:hypothetical protein